MHVCLMNESTNNLFFGIFLGDLHYDGREKGKEGGMERYWGFSNKQNQRSSDSQALPFRE